MKLKHGARDVAAWLILCVAPGCGSDESKVAPPVGTVVDEKTLEIGDQPQAVVLGRGPQAAELQFSPNAAAQRAPVTVRLASNINRRAATPASGTAVQVATRGLTLTPPARMRQMLPPPPPRRAYVAAYSPEQGDAWEQQGAARAPMGAVAQDGMATYEIDVNGSGLWSIVTAPIVPQLAQFSPVVGLAGTALTLLVTGTDFDETATVYFADMHVPTEIMSPTMLRAQVPAALNTHAGQLSVWVENGIGSLARRSNVLYFTVSPAVGAPEIVDYNPDNGVVGDKVQIVGRNLAGDTLKIADAHGRPATPGAGASLVWIGETLQTVEFVIPQGWQTGPISFSNGKGAFEGRIFNVGKNLAQTMGAKISASTEYGGTWTIPRGADNNLVTSWFSANGDCASVTSCTTVPWFKVTLPASQAIGRIALRGNREYKSGYDFIHGKFELLAADDTVLWSASYDLPEPDRDLDIALSSPIDAVAVKFTSEKDESTEPGLAELEVFGF